MAATILARRKNYYEVLEASNKQNEITNWLMWFASVAIEALRRTISTVEFLIDKTKMLDRLKGQLDNFTFPTQVTSRSGETVADRS